ncbi:GDSL-type esterase/lipase family protein [Sphingobium sp. ba1]|jgi:lysophospholipase L1-like esterase|uniref:GDSL-type esterase/lipase family protein n=1 Tax=Sphingobium sp. ba1 TaxID=1522072 RepID=UPI00056352C1|nr:GDSL-type esterase/lipase family protein [Sphingobium sp. ba1]
MRTVNIACARSIAIKGAAALLLALALPGIAHGQVQGGQAEGGQAQDRPPNADPSFPFAREIEAFAKANAASPPVEGATLFLGSSSIRLWDIAGSFTDIPTVNRGFGGASTPDVLRYYRRLLPPTKPRTIIVYVGENDLAAGASPDKVAADILTLLKRLRNDYPRAPIAFLSLKPSPIRWTLWPKMAAINQAVAARATAVRFTYLDVGRLLLARDGLPDASLFRADGLHMKPEGYQRWTRLVDNWLDRVAPATAAAEKAS